MLPENATDMIIVFYSAFAGTGISYNARMCNLMKRTLIFLVLTAFAGSAHAVEEAPDPGQLVSVYGQGEVEVQGANLIKARKGAEEKALKIAIINIVRMLVPPESFPDSAINDLLEGKVDEQRVDTAGVVYSDVFADVDENRLKVKNFLHEFLPRGSDYVQSFKYINEGVSKWKHQEIDLPVEGDNHESESGEVDDMGKVDEAGSGGSAVEGGNPDETNDIKKIDSLLRSLSAEDDEYPELEDDSGKEYYYLNMEFTFFLTYVAKELADYGIRVEGGTGPRVVILIDESTISPVKVPIFLILPSITEEKLREALEGKGYSLVPRDEVRALEDNDRVMDAMNGQSMAVEWLATSLKADYLVLGKAVSKSFPKDGNKPPYVYGEINAKVYDGRNSQVIWEDRIVKRLDGRVGTATLQSVRMASDIFRVEIVKFLENQPGQ